MTEKVAVPSPPVLGHQWPVGTSSSSAPPLSLLPREGSRAEGALAPQGTTRRIHVSLDQGETWSMAQLPSVGHEQFYSILAANEDLVFMHVDEPGGERGQGQSWDHLQMAGDIPAAAM